MRTETETLTVHNWILSYLFNGDASGLTDDEIEDVHCIHSYITDHVIPSLLEGDMSQDYHWHLSIDSWEPDNFGYPTRIPSIPTHSMDSYNLPGNVVEIDVIVMITED